MTSGFKVQELGFSGFPRPLARCSCRFQDVSGRKGFRVHGDVLGFKRLRFRVVFKGSMGSGFGVMFGSSKGSHTVVTAVLCEISS